VQQALVDVKAQLEQLEQQANLVSRVQLVEKVV
jgi:hypothetical protein